MCVCDPLVIQLKAGRLLSRFRLLEGLAYKLGGNGGHGGIDVWIDGGIDGGIDGEMGDNV